MRNLDLTTYLPAGIDLRSDYERELERAIEQRRVVARKALDEEHERRKRDIRALYAEELANLDQRCQRSAA